MPGFWRVELDLPLADAAPTRSLGWIAAAAVCLAVLAFAAAAGASAAARRAALEPRLITLLLPVTEGRAPDDAAVERALAALNGKPGVAFARAVAPAELGVAADTALPRFIDLALNPGRGTDPAALARDLAALVPGAKLVADQALEGETADHRLLACALGLAALLALAAAAAAATRISLVLHRDTIDLLRQLGATDAYLARQLELHAWAHGLRGGALGYLAAVLLVLAPAALPWLPALPAPGWVDWVLLGWVPVTAALLAALAARLAARARSRQAT